MKSHVSLEQHQCFVCGRLYETGNILMDKRLRQSMERHTITGYGLCEEHQKLKDDNYIALIVMDDKKRTGEFAHMRKENVNFTFEKGIGFIDIELFNQLKEVTTHITE